MGLNAEDTRAVGGELDVLRPVLQDRGPSYPYIRAVEVDPDAPDGSYPRGLPPQGVPSA